MENKKLKRQQEIKLTISDLAFGGRGISKLDDLVFFVKDAIPNQEVIAKVSKIKKKICGSLQYKNTQRFR